MSHRPIRIAPVPKNICYHPIKHALGHQKHVSSNQIRVSAKDHLLSSNQTCVRLDWMNTKNTSIIQSELRQCPRTLTVIQSFMRLITKNLSYHSMRLAYLSSYFRFTYRGPCRTVWTAVLPAGSAMVTVIHRVTTVVVSGMAETALVRVHIDIT